jgi:hypothetical protein
VKASEVSDGSVPMYFTEKFLPTTCILCQVDANAKKLRDGFDLKFFVVNCCAKLKSFHTEKLSSNWVLKIVLTQGYNKGVAVACFFERLNGRTFVNHARIV